METLCFDSEEIGTADCYVRIGSSLLEAECHRAVAGKRRNANRTRAYQDIEGKLSNYQTFNYDLTIFLTYSQDIKNLRLTENPAYNADDDKNAKFICALIGLEMSGSFRFCALWSCGCVFSERALKELKTDICSMCQTPYTEQDVVIINGNEEDVNEMKTKMDARVARLKAEKKDKKNKVKKEVAETVVSEVKEIASAAGSSKFIKPSSKIEPTAIKSHKLIGNPAKIAAMKREMISDVLSTDVDAKKMKKDYSVQKDEKATEVYKSIFTSHESEQSQQRAHWITYNPFYN